MPLKISGLYAMFPLRSWPELLSVYKSYGDPSNAMTTAVPELVSGLTRGLFQGDLERHWRSLLAPDVPQAVLGRDEQAVGIAAE